MTPTVSVGGWSSGGGLGKNKSEYMNCVLNNKKRSFTLGLNLACQRYNGKESLQSEN